MRARLSVNGWASRSASARAVAMLASAFSGYEQPFGLSADASGADTGIMSAIDETMGCMLLRIVEKAPGVCVLASFCRVPGKPPCRPGAMMRLEPHSIVSRLFSHPQQPL